MAISINRKWNDVAGVDGVSNTDDSLDVTYFLFADNDEDETDILAFVQSDSNIPHTYLGLAKRNVSFGRHEDTADHWIATASYGSSSASWTLPKLDVDEVRWSIVGGQGQTIKRTYSESLVSETLPTGSTAPALDTTDHELALGLVHRDGDFEIEGIDVPVGGTQISVQTVWDHAGAITGTKLVTAAEYADLHAVNSATWNGFAAGTLQIESFSATYRAGTDPDWDVNFTLNYSKNLTSIAVGNTITVSSKLGHEVLDVLYAKRQVAGLPLPVPIRAAVHKVFPEIDFNTVFGI